MNTVGTRIFAQFYVVRICCFAIIFCSWVSGKMQRVVQRFTGTQHWKRATHRPPVVVSDVGWNLPTPLHEDNQVAVQARLTCEPSQEALGGVAGSGPAIGTSDSRCARESNQTYPDRPAGRV